MTCIVFSQFANVSNFPRWYDRLEIAVHNCTFPYFNSALKQSKRSLKLWHNTAGSCGCFCWHAPNCHRRSRRQFITRCSNTCTMRLCKCFLGLSTPHIHRRFLQTLVQINCSHKKNLLLLPDQIIVFCRRFVDECSCGSLHCHLHFAACTYLQ